MGNPLPLDKPANLNWDPASVELPQIPMLPPGEDAMSMTIAAVLPTLTAPLTASVAALQAKESMFAGKLGAAESAYQNADDSGSQSVGQMSSMLGQVGQMAQQAGGAGGGAGGGMSSFGQIMEQAMQAAQGAGSQGGSQGGAPQGAQAGGSGQAETGPARQQPQASPEAKRDDATAHDDPADRERDGREHRAPVDAAGPGDGSRGAAGPAPVGPPEHSQPGGEDDLARKM